MTVKTRAQLKSENSTDFPDNTARLISPADLRGQMDDIADSMFLAEDLDTPGGPAASGGGGGGGGGGGVHFVDDIEEALAMSPLVVGSVIFVGDDQFVVVDDASLATDGGTVFIPDSELSEVVEEAIPLTYFMDGASPATGANVAKEYSLAHTGLDFESVELVLSDGGETLNIWDLHGHVVSPIYADRTATPQLPHIDTGRGKFRDPLGGFSSNRGTGPNPHPAVRTGGILLRYKYATSGLRLKRVTGPVYDLRWWPVVAVEDEDPSVQTDNSGKICWCLNAAALAKANYVYIDTFYHYGRCIEVPDGMELRGRGPGISGFRVMDNAAWRELLLSVSSAPNEYDYPLNKPATRRWAYDSFFLSNCPTFLPATGATFTRLAELEWDGNIENNLGLWRYKGPAGPGVDADPGTGGPLGFYAYGYAQNFYTGNTPTYVGFATTNHGVRVIPEGQTVALHNVKIHGYAHGLFGNHNSAVIQTGRLELGNFVSGHYTYLVEGVFEEVRCFGYVFGDGLRCRKFVAKSVEMRPAPHPDVFFGLPAYPNSVGTPVADTFFIRPVWAISLNHFSPQYQQASLGYAIPELPPHRVDIGHLYIDATGMDAWPQAFSYQPCIPFLVQSDNIHIKAGKLRFGSLAAAIETIISTQQNIQGGTPYRNAIWENLNIEYSGRKGIQLYNSGSTDGGWTSMQFRNVAIEPRAATHLPGNPSPGGISSLLGLWRFSESIPAVPPPVSIYDGRDIEFSAATAAGLSGDWIDITPPDPGAPVFRLWFDVSDGSTAPSGTDVTLIEINITGASTPAQIAALFSAAIQANTSAASYLTAATFNTKSVVGSFSYYREQVTGGYVGANVTNATGVTTVLRSYRRNWEPSIIGFERFVAADPIYSNLINLYADIGMHRDIHFTFKDCLLGAYLTAAPVVAGNGSFGGSANTVKDQLHFSFENSIFDIRDGFGASTLDLLIYAGKFRNCRVRTASVATGIASLGAGYETLLSEQSGVEEWTSAGGGDTTHDLQTKLFWPPKTGNIRIYPANAATATAWSTMSPYVTRHRKGGVGTAVTDANYYTSSDDRRAPLLRLNFSAATPASTALAIGWSAAVSP